MIQYSLSHPTDLKPGQNGSKYIYICQQMWHLIKNIGEGHS